MGKDVSRRNVSTEEPLATGKGKAGDAENYTGRRVASGGVAGMTITRRSREAYRQGECIYGGAGRYWRR